MGWIGVVTNDGNALLTQWAGGNETLYITRATVGDAFTQEANMRMAKGLQNQRDTAQIIKNEIAGTSARKIKIRIRPMMHVGYIAHEIGIWGKIGAGGMETLLALYQDKDEGVSNPSDDESHEFIFDFTAVIEFNNNGNLTVNIDTSVFVTNGELIHEQLVRRLMADALPNCEVTPMVNRDNGTLYRLTHTDIDTQTIIRTDQYTRNPGYIVEHRTLNSGEYMFIIMNLATKKTKYIINRTLSEDELEE